MKQALKIKLRLRQGNLGGLLRPHGMQAAMHGRVPIAGQPPIDSTPAPPRRPASWANEGPSAAPDTVLAMHVEHGPYLGKYSLPISHNTVRVPHVKQAPTVVCTAASRTKPQYSAAAKAPLEYALSACTCRDRFR